MKRCGGVEVQLYAFVTFALGVGEWSTSYSDHFTLRGRACQYPFDNGQGGHSSDEKNLSSSWESNPGCTTYSLVTILTELPRLSMKWEDNDE
jgi:hypothetical protein